MPVSTGVQIILKTVNRAVLVNLCGPFPQTLSDNDITVTTETKDVVIKGVGFCPQDNIIRLDDFPFPVRIFPEFSLIFRRNF